MRPKLWLLSLTTTPLRAEILSSLLEDEALAVSIIAPPRTGAAQIEAIYDHKPGVAALTARLAVIGTLNKFKSPPFRIKEMPKLDWLKKVAASFPPLPIARWIVHGAHYRSAVAAHRLALQIDATSAFGTGEHPTTRGCLMILDRYLKRAKPARALDMGCGSGILAMAFAKARRRKAVAVDLDPEAVDIARGNVRVNGLQNYIRTGLSKGYAARLVHRHAPYDVIMANIFAGPLSQLAKDLKRHLRPGGIAILAGLLTPQATKVLAAHRMQKIYLVKRLTIGEWSILLLRRGCRSAVKHK